MGLWRNLNDASASAAAFTREFNDVRPEASLEHLLPQYFAEVNRTKLLAFAQLKDTTLQTDANPFGTLDWLEYQLPAASWPRLPQGMYLGSWTIQTDGLHVLAVLTLPSQLSPSMLGIMDFPRLVTQALQDEFTGWNLEDERLALGWNWHDMPGSRTPYGGIIYQLPNTGLVMSGRSTLSSSIPTYVGTDLTKYLPIILADMLTLRFTTRAMSAILNQTGTLSITPDNLPVNLNDPALRVEHQTRMLETWRQVSEMQRTLDAVEDVLLAGRTWITALKSLRELGFQRKPTGPLPSPRMFLHGPFAAEMESRPGGGLLLTPTTQISLKGQDLPTQGLTRVIRNVDNYRLRLIQQSALVKEGIDVQGSLMSARSAEESMQATIQGLEVSRRSERIAVRAAWMTFVSILIAIATLWITADWSKFKRSPAPPAQSLQSTLVADSDFGVTYKDQRRPLLKP